MASLFAQGYMYSCAYKGQLANADFVLTDTGFTKEQLASHRSVVNIHP